MAEFIAMLSGLGTTPGGSDSTDDKKFPWGWVIGGALVAGGLYYYYRDSQRPSRQGIDIEDLMDRDAMPPSDLMGMRRRRRKSSRKSSSRRRHSRRHK